LRSGGCSRIVVDNALSYAGSAQVLLAREGGRLVVTVGDRGPGIAADMLESIFKPFNRGDPSRNRATGGVGLGLSIARSIAVAHGGTLHAENRREGGLSVVAEFTAISPPDDLVAGSVSALRTAPAG
jgi:signal transduction histidine kinase